MTQLNPDFKAFAPYKFIFMYLALFSLVVLNGCSLLPPVQEMSNARQSLQAAEKAGAEVHDSKRFSRAKALLDLASKKIDGGDYAQARELAIQARSIAIESKKHTVTQQN